LKLIVPKPVRCPARPRRSRPGAVRPAEVDTLPELPKLPACGVLTPTIVIDSREQTPLVFTRLPSVRGTLHTADYSLTGAETSFAVERKSLDDLAACCTGENRQRFERELHRLRGFRFRRLAVIGTRADVQAGKYRSGVSPKAVLSTLAAFEVRYDVPVCWFASATEAAEQIESWAAWHARELVLAVSYLARAKRELTDPEPAEPEQSATPEPINEIPTPET
jgi:DNA excision repair protein ERCC-4